MFYPYIYNDAKNLINKYQIATEQIKIVHHTINL